MCSAATATATDAAAAALMLGLGSSEMGISKGNNELDNAHPRTVCFRRGEESGERERESACVRVCAPSSGAEGANGGGGGAQRGGQAEGDCMFVGSTMCTLCEGGCVGWLGWWGGIGVSGKAERWAWTER